MKRHVLNILRNLLLVQVLLMSMLVISSCESSRIESNSFDPNLDYPEMTNSAITSMCFDSQGYLWIGTENGVNRFNGDSYTHYMYTVQDDKLSLLYTIRDIFCDSKDRVWVTSTFGVSMMDGDDEFKLYGIDGKNDNVHMIFESPSGQVYFDSGHTLYRYDEDSDQVVPCFEGMYGHAMTSPDGYLWMLCQKSILRIDSTTYKVVGTYSHGASLVETAYMDTYGTIWIATDTGLVLFSTQTQSLVPLPSYLKSIEKANIIDFFSYDNASTIIATRGGDVYLANPSEMTLSSSLDDSLPFHIPFNDKRIAAVCNDGNGCLWFGSRTYGLTPVPLKVHPRRAIFIGGTEYSFTALVRLPDKNTILVSEGVDLVHFDTSRYVFTKMDMSDLHKKAPDALRNSYIFNMTLDCDNILWLTINNQIFRCSYTRETLTVLDIYTIPDITEALRMSLDSSSRVNGAICSSLRFSFDGKTFTREEGTAPSYGPYFSLRQDPSIIPSTSAKDSKGREWAVSVNGLGRKDNDESEFVFYRMKACLGSNTFNNMPSVVTPSGNIIVFPRNGLLVFDPLFDGSATTTLKIDRFYTDDGAYSVLPYQTEVYTKRNSRNITLGFTSMEFFGLSGIRYAYKMDGVDKSFIELPFDAENNVSYTSLPYGKHNFTIRAYDIDNPDKQIEESIIVHVPRPWYLSFAMNVLYIFFILCIVYLISYLLRELNSTRIQKQVAENEKKIQESLYEKNINTFTSIAHEFKTPLTMISGAVKTLTTENVIPAESNRLHSIIQRNASRMLRMVGQLIDFNKIDNNIMKLSVKHADPSLILKNIEDSFYFGALQKDLVINTDISDNSRIVPIDADKFEKIVYNLLSNAIKYTPAGGKIDIKLDIQQGSSIKETISQASDSVNYLVVSVADDGIGIPENEIGNIFNRYFRATTGIKTNVGGTGIGLYLSAQLAGIHNGFLTAANRADGITGTVFTLALPADDSSYKEEDFQNDEQQKEPISRVYTQEVISSPIQIHAPGRASLMLVDDDYEMLYYLRGLVSNEYNVSTFYSATTALSTLETERPDLIISDVLMLEMDGYKFCEIVKNNDSYSHIPFILLTAKDAVADKIQGMNTGASAYITKPFDPDYLLATVKSLIAESQRNRERISSLTASDIPENILDERDKEFMESLYAIMEENLSKPEINVNDLADRLLLSRTNLYYKIKKVTGCSPGTFFRKYKLNRSRELLDKGIYKVSAVAEMTGFSTTYFAKAFMNEFGILPSQYAPQTPKELK